MNAHIHRPTTIALALLAAALACAPAAAQQRKTVDGIVINLGIVPAETALHAEGHRESHPTNPPSGSQHLLVTLDEAKTGKRIGDAEVEITVTDPHHHVERKPLLHTQAAGQPDYSELFRFAWSGEYTVRVTVTPHPGAKPIDARFTVDHPL